MRPRIVTGVQTVYLVIFGVTAVVTASYRYRAWRAQRRLDRMQFVGPLIDEAGVLRRAGKFDEAWHLLQAAARVETQSPEMDGTLERERVRLAEAWGRPLVLARDGARASGRS